MENKKIGFVVTNGEDTVLSYGFGANRMEAQAYLERGLHQSWSVVKDPQTIKKFINEVRLQDNNDIPSNPALLEQFNEFEKNLKELEQYVEQAEIRNQKLEFLKKALEMDAKIDVSFSSNAERTKEEALSMAQELSEQLDLPFDETHGDNLTWFIVGNYGKMHITIHYLNTKEDKIHALERELAKLKEETA